MPNPSRPSFDHEASLEELAGVGKNRRFDEVIDDEEFEDIQVICKRGTEEIPIAKPNLPHHYALIACPIDSDKKRIIDQRLADAHISPIWFPEGEFQYIEDILQLLLD